MRELPQGRLFTALRLEYKWDVTCHGSDLVFSRSWTGAVEYRASLDAVQTVTSIETAAEPSEENDRSDILTVDFLIRTFVLGEIVPFPLPEGLASPDSPPEANRLAAHFALKRLGCDARFGCPADILWAYRNLKLEG